MRACFDRHQCDKGHRHGYERVYAGLQPACILEIGVYRGASIAAWLDYCDAEITCVDLFDRVPPEEIPVLDRVTWYPGDSTTIQIEGTFDLIIDDGAHDFISQRRTFQNLWPHCRGQYFIEDVWALDDMSPRQRRHPWIQRPEYSLVNYKKLIEALPAGFKRHDLRAGGAPDSYLFEICRDA